MKAYDHRKVGELLHRRDIVRERIAELKAGTRQSNGTPEILKVKFYYNGSDFGFDIPTTVAMKSLDTEIEALERQLITLGVQP